MQWNMKQKLWSINQRIRTQKAIAKLFQKGVNTINEHIKNVLTHLEEQNGLKYFTIAKKEGTRKIKRKILHYNLDVIFNIAIRGQYFAEFSKLINFAQTNGVNKDYLVFVPIKERKFGELLRNSLEGIVDIYKQYKMDKYMVDFYIPQLKLVIEYDEKHHLKQINEDEELKGLNQIIKYIIERKWWACKTTLTS